MITGTELNSDLSRLAVMNADEMTWQPTSDPGIHKKQFELIADAENGRETCLLKLNPGASMAETTLDERTEILVVFGRISDGESAYGQRSFTRYPAGTKVTISSESGAVIFMRRRANVPGGGARLVKDAGDPSNWEAWGGRGSEKVPLGDPSEPGIDGWFGRMIPDLHIPEHDHENGEEIFVLEGNMEDEVGICRAGTWIRFPIGFRHCPFSHNEDVVMLVREGDVRS